MLVLITYDVSTTDDAGPRRLRRVARACSDYGVRVQKSVFECQLGQKEWVALRARLLQETDLARDSLRFYFLDEKSTMRTEHHGCAVPLDLDQPFVV
jgi:CRISPR-associated protein Cas2